MKNIQNAVIKSINLGIEDHGILTCWLNLEFGESSGQGFGGFALDTYNKALDKRVGHAVGTQYILRVLETIGVDNWEDLKGKTIRIDGNDGRIEGIGHIIKNKWFYPREELRDFKN